jgi:amino acid transporter
MGTISLASFLYIFTSFSVNGVENLSEVLKKNGNEYSTVLADVFSQNGMRWMAFVITIAALLGLAAVILSSVMGQARVTRAFAKDGLLWPIFGELDPETNVPVKGAWISTIICALMAATLNLDTLATLCSVGNLLVYAVIDAAVIQMRLAEVPSKPGRRGQIVFIAPWSFLVLSIISAFVVAAEAPLWLNLIFAALLFANYVVLQVLIYQTNQIKKQDAAQGLLATVEPPKALFLCPLMPLLPCFGIWTNCVLSTVGSNGLTWAIFAAFEFVGLLFYACYGYKHSKLRKRIDKHEAAKLQAADGEQEE